MPTYGSRLVHGLAFWYKTMERSSEHSSIDPGEATYLKISECRTPLQHGHGTRARSCCTVHAGTRYGSLLGLIGKMSPVIVADGKSAGVGPLIGDASSMPREYLEVAAPTSHHMTRAMIIYLSLSHQFSGESTIITTAVDISVRETRLRLIDLILSGKSDRHKKILLKRGNQSTTSSLSLET
jgi:hypothetical protein